MIQSHKKRDYLSYREKCILLPFINIVKVNLRKEKKNWIDGKIFILQES